MHQNDSAGVAFFFNRSPEFDDVREGFVSAQFDFDVDGPACQLPTYIHSLSTGGNASTATPIACQKNIGQMLAKNAGKFVCERHSRHL